MGPVSKQKLSQAHEMLIEFVTELDKRVPLTVICGYRGEAEQQEAYLTGHSRAQFGESPHNFKPSLAVDIGPRPLDWGDLKAFDKLISEARRLAEDMHLDLEFGADFKNLVDRPHIQIRNWKEHT
jgi:peptidoglycan LD-endopeptidase CwlK